MTGNPADGPGPPELPVAIAVVDGFLMNTRPLCISFAFSGRLHVTLITLASLSATICVEDFWPVQLRANLCLFVFAN